MAASRENLVWIESLRVLATIAVILIHSGMNIVGNYAKMPSDFLLSSMTYTSFSRFCVPVFVMISGALLLNKPYTIADFLKKRLTRIGLPLLFWGSVYVVFNWQVRLKGRVLPWEQSWDWLTHQASFAGSYHFWFLYMLLGLYAFCPIINAWIQQGNEAQIKYFLGLFGLGLLMSNVEFLGFQWAIEWRYMSGYLGYFVLGYYLSSRPISWASWAKYLYLFAVACTLIGVYYSSQQAGHLVQAFYSYFSWNVVLASVGIFLWFKQQGIGLSFLGPIRGWINDYSFGIYCVHILVLYYQNQWFRINYALLGHPAWGIALCAISCLLISSAVVFLLRKLPFGNYWVG